MLSLVGIARFYPLIVDAARAEKRDVEAARTETPKVHKPSNSSRTRNISDASTVTNCSRDELIKAEKMNRWPVLATLSSRALALMILVHLIVITTNVHRLHITDSTKWKHEHIQAFALFSVLILLTNVTVIALLAAFVCRHSRGMALFAAICVSWIFVGFGVVFKAYSDFYDMLDSHPACSLLLSSLVAQFAEALLLFLHFAATHKINVPKKASEAASPC